MRDGVKSTGAGALVTGGIVSAFCLAACCAIPILLASVGIGAGWLMPVVSASQPYTTILTVFSAFALVASVVIVWRAPKHCEPGSLCARSWFCWTVTGAAVVGAILLVLSKMYA